MVIEINSRVNIIDAPKKLEGGALIVQAEMFVVGIATWGKAALRCRAKVQVSNRKKQTLPTRLRRLSAKRRKKNKRNKEYSSQCL